MLLNTPDSDLDRKKLDMTMTVRLKPMEILKAEQNKQRIESFLMKATLIDRSGYIKGCECWAIDVEFPDDETNMRIMLTEVLRYAGLVEVIKS